MKRQKRDMNERAFQRGYKAGLGGRHQDTCPHSRDDVRMQWLSGWRQGRSDHWDGYDALHLPVPPGDTVGRLS